MTSVPNQGDPCACGSVDTWHPECYERNDGREAKLKKLREADDKQRKRSMTETALLSLAELLSCADEADQHGNNFVPVPPKTLRAIVDELGLLRILLDLYRDETLLGNQPHMIAHQA